MARVVKQYRYYNDKDEVRNQPLQRELEDGTIEAITKEHYISGVVFESPSCFPILQLGIQALPGTKFYLNSSIDPVTIGFTGIYELELDNGVEIIKLTFNPTSMNEIESNINGYLIVDVLYDDGSEVE